MKNNINKSKKKKQKPRVERARNGRKEYPVTVIQYAGISCSEVNAQSTSPSAEKKYPITAVHIIEILNLFANRQNEPELLLIHLHQQFPSTIVAATRK